MDEPVDEKPALQHLDIPPRYRRYGLTAFPEATQAAVIAWMNSPDCWCLYLYGETNARKSSLAAAALMELRERWWEKNWRPEPEPEPARLFAYIPSRNRSVTQIALGVFLPSHEAVHQLRRIDSEAFERCCREWRAARFLVIDDLGKHRDTPHVTEQLLHLIHHRYDYHDPSKGTRLIVTANMDLDTLEQRIDDSTARRLAEGRVIHMTVPQKAGQ